MQFQLNVRTSVKAIKTIKGGIVPLKLVSLLSFEYSSIDYTVTW